MNSTPTSLAGPAIPTKNTQLMAHEAFADFMARCWQPMSTAPKSTVDEFGHVQGVYLLVFEPARADDEPYTDMQIGIQVCWWEPLMWGGEGCWYDGNVRRHPTFWMPLPTAPALQG